MSETGVGQASPFSGRIVFVLLAVGILSFAAVMALVAWSPELTRRDRPGATPYSRSATGYAGFIDMLEASGQPARVSRLPSSVNDGDGRLLVLPLPLRGRTFDLDEVADPALIVLPKWSFIGDPARRAFELNTRLADEKAVDGMLGLVEEDAAIKRAPPPGRLDTPFGTAQPEFDPEIQLIESDVLFEIAGAGGGQLLSRVPGREVYILSDPDLLNNFGLARAGNAELALGLVDYLTDGGRRPVVFDATLHGFQRSNNLLKAMLDIPFLGATLIALATAGLVGWAASIRFGAPERDAPPFAPGKQALADNSAGLISMTRREARMAPGYLALTRRALARELGLPRTLSEAETGDLLNRMGAQAGLEQDWNEVGGGLSAPAASRDDLRHKARALWRWRKEMTHGH